MGQRNDENRIQTILQPSEHKFEIAFFFLSILDHCVLLQYNLDGLEIIVAPVQI